MYRPGPHYAELIQFADKRRLPTIGSTRRFVLLRADQLIEWDIVNRVLVVCGAGRARMGL